MEDRHQITPYPLRVPPELRKRLEEAARDGGRSLNAEIVARLEQSFEPRESAIVIEDLEALLTRALEQIKAQG